ncbi:MAG: hypothetical protein LBE35_09305 [Clostridiales bacterium]|jgi:hypothetical protein|nr:hypothetical protein [Clostridiales bacterium]
MNININTVVADMISGEHYLILWIASDKSYGYWHNLSSSSRIPTKFFVADIAVGIADDRYQTDSFMIKVHPEESLTI